jgi:hypothetical protein
VAVKQDVQEPEEDFEIPVWSDLPKRWYVRLNQLARRTHVPRSIILQEALKCYAQLLRGQESPFRKLKAAEQGEQAVKDFFGKFSRNWWQSLSPEQKALESEKRRKAALSRWEQEKSKNRDRGKT